LEGIVVYVRGVCVSVCRKSQRRIFSNIRGRKINKTLKQQEQQEAKEKEKEKESSERLPLLCVLLTVYYSPFVFFFFLFCSTL
jgi:hypothetical protein